MGSGTPIALSGNNSWQPLTGNHVVVGVADLRLQHGAGHVEVRVVEVDVDESNIALRSARRFIGYAGKSDTGSYCPEMS